MKKWKCFFFSRWMKALTVLALTASIGLQGASVSAKTDPSWTDDPIHGNTPAQDFIEGFKYKWYDENGSGWKTFFSNAKTDEGIKIFSDVKNNDKNYGNNFTYVVDYNKMQLSDSYWSGELEIKEMQGKKPSGQKHTIAWYVDKVYMDKESLMVGQMDNGNGKTFLKNDITTKPADNGRITGKYKVGEFTGTAMNLDSNKIGEYIEKNSSATRTAEGEEYAYLFCTMQVSVDGKTSKTCRRPLDFLHTVAETVNPEGFKALKRGMVAAGNGGKEPNLNDTLTLIPKDKQDEAAAVAFMHNNVKYTHTVSITTTYKYEYFGDKYLDLDRIMSEPAKALSRDGWTTVFTGQRFDMGLLGKDFKYPSTIPDRFSTFNGTSDGKYITNFNGSQGTELPKLLKETKYADAGNKTFKRVRNHVYEDCYFNVAGSSNEDGSVNHVIPKIKKDGINYLLVGVMVTYGDGDFIGYNKGGAKTYQQYLKGKKTARDYYSDSGQGSNSKPTILALDLKKKDGLGYVDPNKKYGIKGNNMPEYFLGKKFNGKTKTMTQKDFANALRENCRVYTHARIDCAVHFIYAKETKSVNVKVKAKYIISDKNTGEDQTRTISSEELARAVYGNSVVDKYLKDEENSADDFFTFPVNTDGTFKLFGSNKETAESEYDKTNGKLSWTEGNFDSEKERDKLAKVKINGTTYYLGAVKSNCKVDGFKDRAGSSSLNKLADKQGRYSDKAKLASALRTDSKYNSLFVVDTSKPHQYAVEAKKHGSKKLEKDTEAGYYPINDVLYRAGKGSSLVSELCASGMKIAKVKDPGEDKNGNQKDIEITLYFYNFTPVLNMDIVMVNKGGKVETDAAGNITADQTTEYAPVLWKHQALAKASGVKSSNLKKVNVDLSKEEKDSKYWMTQVHNAFPGYSVEQQGKSIRDDGLFKVEKLRSYKRNSLTTYSGNTVTGVEYTTNDTNLYQRYGSFYLDLNASPYSSDGKKQGKGTVAAFYNDLARYCMNYSTSGDNNFSVFKEFKVAGDINKDKKKAPGNVPNKAVLKGWDGYDGLGSLLGLTMSNDNNRYVLPARGTGNGSLSGISLKGIRGLEYSDQQVKFRAGMNSSKVRTIVSIYYPETGKDDGNYRDPYQQLIYYYYTGSGAGKLNNGNAYKISSSGGSAVVNTAVSLTFSDTGTAVYPSGQAITVPDGYTVTVTRRNTGWSSTPGGLTASSVYPVNSMPVTWTGANPIGLTIDESNTVAAWGLYEVNIEATPAPTVEPKHEELTEKLPFGDAELDPSLDPVHTIDSRVRAAIKNGSSSSASFQPSDAIPSSEYLLANGEVPKYLLQGTWIKHTENVKVPVTYVLQDTTTEYQNGIYVTKTRNAGQLQVEVDRSTVYYTLGDASVYVPETVDIKNDLLGEKGKLTAHNLASWTDGANETLGFYVHQKGGCSEAPQSPTVAMTVTDYEQLLNELGVGEKNFENAAQAAADLATRGADLKSDADSRVGAFVSWNDSVTFNNGEGSEVNLLVNYGLQVTNEAYGPAEVPEAGLTENGEFQEDNVLIAPETSNGVRKSSALAKFKKVKEYSEDGSVNRSSTVKLPASVNHVNVYTPAAINIDLGVFGINRNQSAKDTSRNTVALDQEFTVHVGLTGFAGGNYEIPNGEPYSGYGSKSYERYTKAVQIKFPFPCIPVKSNTGTGEGQQYEYYQANEWITLDDNADGIIDWNEKDFTFYVPSWAETVPKGEVVTRALALNWSTGAGEENLANDSVKDPTNFSDSKDLTAPDYAEKRIPKIERVNYAANDTDDLGLVGRLYNFGIVDVADYPMWESYFRDKQGLLTGNAYFSGLSDVNGNERGITDKYTVPLINGSHPTLSGTGVTKPGYVTRFKVNSVGDFGDDVDYVMIKPSFYWVSKSNSYNEKNNISRGVEVDVYYDETINGKQQRYVKVGGAMDKSNKHYLSLAGSKFLASGNTGFGVSKEALKATADYYKQSVTEFSTTESPIWTSSNIMLNKHVRTFIGTSHKAQLSNGNTLDYGILSSEVAGRTGGKTTKEEVLASLQDWYGTYYLPSTLYVAKKSEGNPDRLTDAGKLNWFDGGYLIVHFDISLINDGEVDLYYDASRISHTFKSEVDGSDYTIQGCNMWQIEDYANYKVSADRFKTEFSFADGDAIVYDLGNGTKTPGGGPENTDDPENPDDPDKPKWPWEWFIPHSGGASDDYGSGGTH